MNTTVLSVSIVIPAFNERDTISACILAALNQTVAASEVIVVDNRSTDGTGDIVKALQLAYPDAPLIYFEQNSEQGLVPTRNFGLDRAQGEIIGRIDADSVLEPTWVAEVQKAFADDSVRRVMLVLAREYHFVFGSNMALRASAWRDIQPHVCRDIDDELHEDIDISVHLHERHHRVAYVSEMVAGMSARRIDDSPSDYYYYVNRFERTYQRHNVRNLGVRAPMWLLIAAYPALKAVRKGQEWRASAVIE